MTIGWIIYVVVMVIATVLQIVLRPKTNFPKLLPGKLENIPIAEQGAPKGVLFGKRFIPRPNVVYYGQVHAEPITMSAGGKSGS